MRQHRHLLARLRYRLKRFASTRPALYLPLVRYFGQGAHLLVGPHTDACIEGYPRSANSFAVAAFRSAQSREVTVAHHTHTAANLIRACELGIPAVLLVRSPRDAVVSYQALSLEASVEAGETHPVSPIPLIEHLRSWLTFYRATRPYTDRCVIAPFRQVIEDFAAVGRQLNEQFGRNFGIFEHTEANVDRIRADKGYHALPSERRDAIKSRVHRDFDRMLKDTPGAEPLLAEVGALYEWYQKRASL